MDKWQLPTFLALLMWGFWGFFPKLAVKYIDPKSTMVYESIGGLLGGLAVLIMIRFNPQFTKEGFIFGLIAGILGILGAMFYLFAVQHGKVSVVVAITALYPIITILLAYFFLSEPISIKQFIGICLAVVSIYLISTG